MDEGVIQSAMSLVQKGRDVVVRRKMASLTLGALVAGGGFFAYTYNARKKRVEALKKRDPVADGASVAEFKTSKLSQSKSSLKSVAIILRLLWGKMGREGIQNILTLVGLAVLRTALSNRIARVQGYLFESTFLRKVPLFCRLLLENLLLCLGQSVILSSTRYLRGLLSLEWREILTNRIHQDYFKNMVFYKMTYVDRRISNPEQSISSDVPRFCTELSDLVQENIIAICDAIFYTYRLCTYTHPKYALGILAYVLTAGFITTSLSPSFGKLIAKEQRVEGEYRQLHSRLCAQSESITFYGGQDREGDIVRGKFQELTRHVAKLFYTQWWFGIIQDFFLKYCGATWAVVLIIGPFFGGQHTRLSSLRARAQTLSNMRYHTSVVIALFHAMGTLGTSSRRVSRISGLAGRIQALLTVSHELRTGLGSDPGSSSGEVVTEAQCIEFDDVTVVTPVGTKLVENLSLKVEAGHNLLITGPNGSGKSSLFRVLGGLWPLTRGRIFKPGSAADLSHDIFYVPQRPYTAIGTLQDQLVYPLTSADLGCQLSETQIRNLLRIVDLEGLVERYALDAEVQWGSELSLGEQQRLGMARLFYHAPAFAILDECTSAVTTDMEERFCARVREMGTTCVTISHRPALVAFHDTVLALDGEGGWALHRKREEQGGNDLPKIEEVGDEDQSERSERKTDAEANVQRFMAARNNMSTNDLEEETKYAGTVLASAPPPDPLAVVPSIPRPVPQQRSLAVRTLKLAKILLPRLAGWQGAQLSFLVGLVLTRTVLSDRIASLNGATVNNMLQQDLGGFQRLILVSVLQSAASSLIAPTLRYLTVHLALSWRRNLTRHLLDRYFRNNAFYKAVHLSTTMGDADARISQDSDKLCRDVSSLVTNLVKPLVDICWFTWRMRGLTGQRGVGILYAYMLLGLGFLRAVTPDFGELTKEEQRLEGAFRYVHERLRSHAESVAFFGGGSREKQVVEARFSALLSHQRALLRQRWIFGTADEFVTKQLPLNVTWLLSLLFSLDAAPLDTLSLRDEGQLAHSLRFLATVVSQSFQAFGDGLEMYRKFLELSGGVARVSELDELLEACQEMKTDIPAQEASQSQVLASWQPPEASESTIAFRNVDVVTPTRKLLARQLTLHIEAGQSLLVTGPNGSGKSSLFRVLGGLWPVASGSLSKPSGALPGAPPAHIFYVPQKPYTALGTLRDQIIYPLSRDRAALFLAGKISSEAAVAPTAQQLALLDQRLQVLLEDVRLLYLLEREGGWGAVQAWEDMLSLGEQQRLGMARLFFHRPTFGILDECTNATSVDVEESLYKLAQSLNITVVTISQRPALIPYHSQELRLIDGEGDWQLRSIVK